MANINSWSKPKEVQREALKWLANNGPSVSHQIKFGIAGVGPLWNIGQNLSVLKKNKLITRNPQTAVWSITTAGSSQARAWMVADGDIQVNEEPQPEYVWQIAVVSIKGSTEKTKMDSDWEAFAADHVGISSIVYFRKLVEK